MTIAAILKTKETTAAAGRGAAGVLSLHPDATVADAVVLLADERIGAAPVIEDGRVVGIFSERDVIHSLRASGTAAMEQRIGDVMTTAVKSIGSSESAIGALSLMTQRRIRHLPVIDGDVLVGFVSIGDLVKYRIDRIEADAAAMREYIQSA